MVFTFKAVLLTTNTIKGFMGLAMGTSEYCEKCRQYKGFHNHHEGTPMTQSEELTIFENRLQACFLRLMPWTDLDADPPVKHIKRHEDLEIGKAMDEAMKILSQAISSAKEEERERIINIAKQLDEQKIYGMINLIKILD